MDNGKPQREQGVRISCFCKGIRYWIWTWFLLNKIHISETIKPWMTQRNPSNFPNPVGEHSCKFFVATSLPTSHWGVMSFPYSLKSGSGMWLLCPTEYGGNGIGPVLGVIFRGTGNFNFLLLCHYAIEEAKELHREAGIEETWGSQLTPQMNSQLSAQTTLPAIWVRHLGCGSLSPSWYHVEKIEEVPAEPWLNCKMITK